MQQTAMKMNSIRKNSSHPVHISIGLAALSNALPAEQAYRLPLEKARLEKNTCIFNVTNTGKENVM